MIISRTPFRVSFFGGGTDFPDFYREHGGAVISTTIDKYCYILTHRLGPFFKYRFRANYAKAESVKHPREFRHPLVRECLLHLKISDGLEIAHVADLPGRTGLGTSSSFTVGLLNVLHTFLGHKVTHEELTREAIHIERVRVGDAGGHQDQCAAAHGGLLRITFSGKQRITVKRLSLTSQRSHELQSRLMLFYTGLEQSAGKILKEQHKRVSRNNTALKHMLQMVDEAERILCSSEDLNAFGDLLHESWLRKKSLSKGISNNMVDDAYEAARSAGARGGKLLGAGGRGFLLLSAESEKQATIRSKLKSLKEVTFSFSSEGSQIVFRTAE